MSYHKKTFPFRATDSIAINLPTSSTGLGVFEPKRSNVLRISSVDMFLSSSEWLSISSGFQACFTVFHSSINPQCRCAGPSINFCWKTEDTAGSQSLINSLFWRVWEFFSKKSTSSCRVHKMINYNLVNQPNQNLYFCIPEAGCCTA